MQSAEKEAAKAKLIELMEKSDIAFNLLECCGEGRKSVLYLTDRKIETNYRLDHGKAFLTSKLSPNRITALS